MNIQAHLDKNDVVGSIRAQLRHPTGGKKVWILVEGETDQKLFTKLINAPHVEIEIAYGGFNNVVQAVSELLQETKRILGIRDADFLHLEGKTSPAEHILLTDLHDAEMMLMACDYAYRAVAAEYFHKTHAIDRGTLLQSIAFFGGLRWLNDADRVELNFKGIGLGDFYDGNTAMLNEQQCLAVVLKRSPHKKKDISSDEVKGKIQGVTDFFNLCNGHDAQKALALCATAHSPKGCNDVEIGKAFRVAYRFEDFQKTDLYQQLQAWSHQQAIILFNHIQED